MQDMSGGNYPAGQEYANDKIVGIIIMILSLCGVVIGGLAVVGGGFIAAGGAAAANTANNGAAVPTAAAGGMVAIVGIVLLVLSFMSIAIGWGIMKSLRWGFLVGSIVYGINMVLNLMSLNQSRGILGLLIGAALFAYCVMRLTGKLGPKPA